MRLLALVVSSALALPGSISAAEINPGGALDLTISGFARFLVGYGNLEDKFDDNLSSFDFFNDTEVHVTLRGVHEPTGLEYGGTVEFEGDTNATANTDETWLFLRGGFGELRFGDTDSAANTMKVGAYTIAVGTGGIDGDIVNLDTAVEVDLLFTEPQSASATAEGAEDLTKIVYFSPQVGGFQFGLSYTPDNASGGDALANVDDPFFAGEDGRRGRQIIVPPAAAYDDIISAGLSYAGSVGNVGILASVVGSVDPHRPDERWIVNAGAAATFYDFSLAGSIGYDKEKFAQQLGVVGTRVIRRGNDRLRNFFIR
jgi:outer membrane protein OmpU